MTVASGPAVPRRRILAGGLAACGLGAAALAAYMFPGLRGQRYAPSPFDDLLAQLPDRDNAAKMGAAILSQQRHFDAHAAARVLRDRLSRKTFGQIVSDELAAGRTLEFRGWIVPESLGTLCALAAFVAPPEAGS